LKNHLNFLPIMIHPSSLPRWPIFSTLCLLLAIVVFSRAAGSRDLSKVPDQWLFEIADEFSFASMTNESAHLGQWASQPANAHSPAGLLYRSVVARFSTNSNRDSLLVELEAEYKTNQPPEILILKSAEAQFLAQLRAGLIKAGLITNVIQFETDPYYLNMVGDADVYLLVAAQTGHSVAQSKLGDRYLGFDAPTELPRDTEEGLRWHFKASSQGSARSQERLISLLQDSETAQAVPDEKWPVIMAWAELLSKTNSTASYLIAVRALEEADRAEGYRKALALFAKAAEQGSKASFHKIGLIHLAGLAGQQDLPAAKAAFLQGAAKGYFPSLVSLGEWEFEGIDAKEGPPNLAEARKWFEKVPADFFPSVPFHLGLLELMQHGSYAAALPHFENAVRQGHAEAKLYLALVLERDAATPEIMSRVIELYNDAAEAGSPRAQYALGRLIEHGVVGDTPPEQAVPLYLQAAQAGYWRAQEALAKLYGDGKHVKASRSEMMRWVEVAALNGSDHAAAFAAKWYGSFPGSEAAASRFKSLELENARAASVRKEELFPNAKP